MKLVTASANHDLDEILDLIAEKVQITPTQFNRAETSYNAVGDWLQADGSPVNKYSPSIFPQGSMRLETTVKPVDHTEFDLDLVCRIKASSNNKPSAVYDLLLKRMRDHGKYDPIISEEHRCIRLEYANDFHLDIVPAIPDPNCGDGKKCLLIPNRKKNEWELSDPLGYADWFEDRTRISIKLSANLYERKDIERLKQPTPLYMKRPLRVAVQLLKRWRDIAFKKDMELAPSSIILTTLAASLYRGEHHPTDAIMNVLNDTLQWASNEKIKLAHPTNPKELITRKWSEIPDSYQAFIEGFADLRLQWNDMIRSGKLVNLSGTLKELFDEEPVGRALRAFGEGRREARENGNLYAEPSGNIVTAPKGYHYATPIKDHQYYGD